MPSFTTNLALSYLTPSSLSAKAIPAVPTLAELQKHAESLGESISGALPTLPSHGTAAGAWAGVGVGKPGKVAGGERREALKSGAGAGVGAGGVEAGAAGRSWYLPAPPEYSETDPREQRSGGAKLKKQRIGWRRVQQEIPGEGPRMEGSRAYAESVASGQQQGVHDAPGQQPCQSTWWEWVTCRTCT
ncbi:hypothetical protein IAT38_006577 [Cryptococcus sp. DSM 104549]